MYTKNGAEEWGRVYDRSMMVLMIENLRKWISLADTLIIDLTPSSRPGQGRDGIRATAAGNNTITIKAEDDEGTAVLNLTFRNGPVTAVQSFSIRLRGEE